MNTKENIEKKAEKRKLFEESCTRLYRVTLGL